MKKLNHFWRIIATGICFFYFGLGCIFLTLFIFPFQKIFIPNKNRQNKIARKTVHLTFRWFIKLLDGIGVFTFELEEAKKLKQLQGQLILANHPSLIDVVVLISMIPNADCVVKAHLFRNPFFRGVVKSTGYINNANPEGLLNDCKISLNAGNNLIVFPEGTRTTPGQKLKFLRGAANIALRCQAKITYVLINVNPTTLTKSEPWYKVPECRAIFSAKIIEKLLKAPNYDENSIIKDVRLYNEKLETFFNQQLINYRQ